MRDPAGTVLASCVYCMAPAMASSSVSFGKSCAKTLRPGCARQPAAATADNCINLRRAILLNGVSFSFGSKPGTSPGTSILNDIEKTAMHCRHCL